MGENFTTTMTTLVTTTLKAAVNTTKPVVINEVVIGSTVTVMIFVTGGCTISCLFLFLRSNQSVIGNSLRSLHRCWRNVWYRVTGGTPPQPEGTYESASITDQPVESESVSYSIIPSWFSRLFSRRPLPPLPLPPTPPNVPPRTSLGHRPYDEIRDLEARLGDTVSNPANVSAPDASVDSAGDDSGGGNRSMDVHATSSSGEGLSNAAPTSRMVHELQVHTSPNRGAGLAVDTQACRAVPTAADLPIPRAVSSMPTEHEVTDDGSSSDSSVPEYIDGATAHRLSDIYGATAHRLSDIYGATGPNLGNHLETTAQSRPSLCEGNDVSRETSPLRTAASANTDTVPSAGSSLANGGHVEVAEPDWDSISRHQYDNGIMEIAMPILGDRIRFDFHEPHYYGNGEFAREV